MSQVSRWVVVINNFDENFDYVDHLRNPDHKVKRAVLGFERSNESGTRHIQGYVEFQRSVRLAAVHQIFPRGHWETARSSSLANYLYCTKQNNFQVIGDFSREQRGMEQGKSNRASVPLIIKGMLDSSLVPQIKVSAEYAERHIYYDKITSYLRSLLKWHELYNEWSHKKLFLWQYQVLMKVKQQSDREIHWIVDEIGNRGKTFLANYLCILYGFKLLDGHVSARDLAHLMSDDVKGICFDVSRASQNFFDYSTLESVKNGYLVSGKYYGKVCRIPVVPVVVFANCYPNLGLLSQDRWNILKMGEGPLSDLSANPVISPESVAPFVEPPHFPDLTDDFSLKEYLCTGLGIDRNCLNGDLTNGNQGNSQLEDHNRRADESERQENFEHRGCIQQDDTFRPVTHSSQMAGVSGFPNMVNSTCESSPNSTQVYYQLPKIPKCSLHPNTGKFYVIFAPALSDMKHIHDYFLDCYVIVNTFMTNFLDRYLISF